MPYIGAKELKASDIRRFDVTSSTSATHTLTWTPPTEQSLIVTINGIKQHEDAYSVSGTTLTLSSPLVATDKLEVIGINDIGTTITPAQNSVDADKIADNAVTTAKIADDQITSAKLANTINITSGNSLTIDSGATITNNGTASGFFDGLKEADCWANTTTPLISTATWYYLGTNASMSRSVLNFSSPIGTGISYSGSDWSYPSTGTYQIIFSGTGTSTTTTSATYFAIFVSDDNFATSNYGGLVMNSLYGANNYRIGGTPQCLQTITDVTQQKFRVGVYNVSTTFTIEQARVTVIKVSD